MACAAITSFMTTLSLSLGDQSLYLRASGDEKEIMEVLHGKLDSLRTLVEETDKIIRDPEALKTLEAQTIKVAYTAEDLMELRLGELPFSRNVPRQRISAALASLKVELEAYKQSIKAGITSLKRGLALRNDWLIDFEEAVITSVVADIKECRPRSKTATAITSFLAEIRECQGRTITAITSFVAEIKESQRRTNDAITSLEVELEAYQHRFVMKLKEGADAAITSLLAEIKESQRRINTAVTSLRVEFKESHGTTDAAEIKFSHLVESEKRSQQKTNYAIFSFKMVFKKCQQRIIAPISSFMATQSLSKEVGSQRLPLCECLQQVIEYADATAEEWMKVTTISRSIKHPIPQTLDHGDSSQHVLNSENIMVGYDKEHMTMQHLLFGDNKEFKVISLVGMGGIGKTTFATRIFSEPKIRSHFDVCAKITVSQEYHVRNLYLGLLSYTSSRVEGLDEKNDGELEDLLQKSLKGKRYFVIIDDIWTTQAWDEIKRCFPYYNGSRILLTTRNTEVAEYASLGLPPYQMRLLTFDECWNLFYHKVFQNQCLTPEFEEMGKEITRKCQGLPLATVVMAGVLLKKGKSLDEWKKVVEDVNLFMSTDLDHHCSTVLALSYHHLPHHLRACLLYLVVFTKSSDIPVSKLARLWAAEGFVKIRMGESFEIVAGKCLKELIDRSLVFVNKWSYYGKIKSCGIHDMINGFCSQEAQNTNFLNIIRANNVQCGSSPSIPFPSHPRRLSFRSSVMNYKLRFGDDSDTEVRSILYSGNRSSTKALAFSCFELLLDIISVTFNYRPDSIGHLFCLRYLAFT